MMTPQEVANRLGYTRATVYRWIKRGWLPVLRRPNGTIWIQEADLGKVIPYERWDHRLAREARDAGAVV